MIQAVIIQTTLPASADADALARQLLDAHLVACVQIMSPMRSLYRWNGTIESASECLLVCKTEAHRVREVRAAIQKQHPYQVPEILEFAATGGLPAYLEWIRESVAL